MKNTLKRLLDRCATPLCRSRTGARALLALYRGLLHAAEPLMRRHPYRYMSAYRALRRLHTLIQPGRQPEDARDAAARDWWKADRLLEDKIRRYIAWEPDLARLKHINRTINEYESFLRLERLKSHPARCYIEVTNVCNLKCRMCTQSFLEFKNEYLQKDVLLKFAPALRAIEHVSLMGWGETFMHKQYQEFLRQTQRYGVRSRIISNGLMLDEKTIRFLVEAQLTELWVSLDAIRPETYHYVRGVDKFDDLLAKLRLLNAVKEELQSPWPELNINFVSMRRNIAELPGFIALARELKATAVHCNHIIVYSEDMREQSPYYAPEEANRALRATRAAAEELGIVFFGPADFDPELMEILKTDKRDYRQAYRKCREPFEFTYLNCAGKVAPCCTDSTPLGDITKNSFEEIWNGPAYRAYRRSLLSDQPSPFCKNCMQIAQRGVNEIESHIRIMTPDGQLAESAKGA